MDVPRLYPYFGGGGVAMAASGAQAVQLPSLGVEAGVLVGCASFLTAALCVALAGSLRAIPTEQAAANL